MKILVIGGGGREHALVWGLRKSPSVSKIWCAPGNGGIAQDAECFQANLNSVTSLADLGGETRRRLDRRRPGTAAGSWYCRRICAPRVCGCSVLQLAARSLRVAKSSPRNFSGAMPYPLPPLYGVYDTAQAALAALRGVPWPVVLKADGLCAGKGVLVAGGYEEAADFVDRVLEKREFGEGGARLLLEGRCRRPRTLADHPNRRRALRTAGSVPRSQARF